jgi:tetratricopeptide (TPR) repeat protein
MTIHRRWYVVLLAAALLFTGRAAVAQTPEQVAEAERLFNQGLDAVRGNDFDKALELFRQSRHLNPAVPIVTFNIALCHRKLENAPDAVQELLRFLEEGGAELPQRDRAQELVGELSAQVGVMQIRVEEPGANVLIDGEAVGPSPLNETVYVSPGSHRVEVRWTGVEEPEVRQGDVPAGLERPVEVAFVKPEIPVEPPDGSGGPDTPGELLPSWPFWTMVGATGAFALTSALTLTFGQLAYDDYVAGGRADQALADRGEALDLTGWVFLGLAGAALVTGTVLFFYTDFSGDFGGDETPSEPDEEPPPVEAAFFPGSLVLRW